jgi:hypothetical protein
MKESELERSRRINSRPINTVLVPCDELEEMKAELKALREWKKTWLPFLQKHFGIEGEIV